MVATIYGTALGVEFHSAALLYYMDDEKQTLYLQNFNHFPAARWRFQDINDQATSIFHWWFVVDVSGPYIISTNSQ